MRILVVDDDALAAEMIGAVLEDRGHEVRLCENGVEAAQQLNDDPGIEMVISDMNMPMVSGLDLFRELRAQGCTRPFILLTGDDPQRLRQQEPGLDACLLKDFGLDETLPRLIEEIWARRGAGPQ